MCTIHIHMYHCKQFCCHLFIKCGVFRKQYFFPGKIIYRLFFLYHGQTVFHRLLRYFRFCSLFKFKWNRHNKCRSLSFFRFHGNGAWHQFHEIFCNGQPQSASSVFLRSCRTLLLEWLEQPRLHLLRHALPGIFHKEIKVCFLLLHIEFLHFDCDFPTGRREFVSIGNQVQQNLVHTKSIPNQMCMRHLFVLYLKRYPFLLALRFINRADGH